MAKSNSTLTQRAANIKPEYSPLQGPPNPHAAEARDAIRQYAHESHLIQNEAAQQNGETILLTWTRPDDPAQPRTFTDIDIAAWYAVAKSISEAAHSGATPQKESER